MQGESLRSWLQKLQDEFVRRMAALDEELKRVHDQIYIGEEDSVDGCKTEISVSMTVAERSTTAESKTERDIHEEQYMMSGAL